MIIVEMNSDLVALLFDVDPRLEWQKKGGEKRAKAHAKGRPQETRCEQTTLR